MVTDVSLTVPRVDKPIGCLDAAADYGLEQPVVVGFLSVIVIGLLFPKVGVGCLMIDKRSDADHVLAVAWWFRVVGGCGT